MGAGLSAWAGEDHSAPLRSGLDDPQIQDAAREGVTRARARAKERDVPAAREARARSRTRHAGLSDAEARAGAGDAVRRLLQAPAFEALAADAPRRVERWLDGDRAALITTRAGDRALVESDLPLRGHTAAGSRAPLDLALVPREGGLEPASALVRSTLPKRLADGIAVPYGDRSLTVELAGGADAGEPRVEGDKALYPNAGTDTDVIAAARPTGVQLFGVLRSERSPETLALSLGGLPEGAELREAAGGRGAEVRVGGERVAALGEARAYDAEGEPLRVTTELAGNRVELAVSHRGADVAYPIVVDPPVETFTWNGASNNDYDFWSQSFVPQPGSPSHASGFATSRTGAWGSGLYAVTNGSWHYHTDQLVDRFQAPGDAFVYRADFNQIWHDPSHPYYSMCMSAGLFNNGPGTWDSPSWTGCGGYGIAGYPAPLTVGQCANGGGSWPSCSSGAGSAGNEARFAYWAYGNGTRSVYDGVKYMAGATIYLNDRVAPTIGWSGAAPSGTWSSGTGPYSVQAQDSGLGVSTVMVSSPTSPSWPSALLAPGCNGGRADRAAGRCSNPKTLSFNTSTLPEGPQILRAAVHDAVGNSASFDHPVKVDRSSPSSVTLGGELGDDANRVVGRKTVGLRVTGDDAYSGVASVSYSVASSTNPAVALQQGSSSNPGCQASGCPGNYGADFSVDTTTLADGTYTLTGNATDQVGKTKTTTLTFTVDQNVLTPQQALARIEGSRPDVVADSTEVVLDGELIDPALAPPEGGEYDAEGTLRDAAVDTQYDDGYDVGNEGSSISVAPAGVGADATPPTIASGDAAVYANSQYATDAVVRPSGNGIETFLQLRNGSAPESFAWQVSLAEGQTLEPQPNGDVAVVDPAPPPRSELVEPYPEPPPAADDVYADQVDDGIPLDPNSAEPIPPDDPVEPVEETPEVSVSYEEPGISELNLPGAGSGANDTAAQLNRETEAAAEAQQRLTSGSVQVVFLAPTARDANGAPVPVSMTASGSTLTVSVPHRGRGYAYPITVDPEASAAGDDGGRSADLRAARNNNIKVMTWNIKGWVDLDEKYRRIGAVIGTQQPLVAVLQEVCNGKWIRQLRAKLDDMGWLMDIEFASEKGLRCPNGTLQGNAILARDHNKLRSIKTFYFDKTPGEGFKRVILGGTISTAGRSMRVYSNHLPLKSAKSRAHQIGTMGRMGRSYAQSHIPQVLIGGDFNQNAHTNMLDQGFRDRGFAYVGPHCGNTLRNSSACIDHLYRWQDTIDTVSSAIITQTTASDHYPVKFHVRYK